MKHKLSKNIVPVLLCIVLTSTFTTVAFAAEYLYYNGGLLNPAVEVEDRLDYLIFHSCIDEWNSTDTPVEITQVPGSGQAILLAGSGMTHGMECIRLNQGSTYSGDVLGNSRLN